MKQGTIDDFLRDAKPSVRALNRDAIAAQRSAALRGVQGVNAAAVQTANARREANARKGLASKRNGDSWEDFLAGQHQAAADAGLAYLQKQEPEVAGANGRARRVGKSGLDYAGHVHVGGEYPRALYVEAKNRGGHRLMRDRWYRDERGVEREDRNGIEKHQLDLMERLSAEGALVLVAVRLVRAEGELLYAVEYAALRGLWAAPRGGRPSVGPEELAGWEMRDGAPGGYLSAWGRGRRWCDCKGAGHALACVWGGKG